MIKYIRKYSTLLIFILLIYLRLRVRSLNPLWTDELAEIGSLRSLRYLITVYLPSIPGGFPGHYLLILPLQYLFPFNKYILGLPGLISHILVFLFIPNVISKLKNVDKNNLFISGLITRFLFAIDPILTFQAMEVRPYSFLPLLWIILFFVIINLDQQDKQSFTIKRFLTGIIFWVPILFLLFIWHFYGVIMFFCIYIFTIWRKVITLLTIKKRKYSIITILISIISSLPVWNYLSKGTFTFKIDTFSTILVTIMQIYSINRGFPQGITWQNWIYFFLLIIMLIIFLWQLWTITTNRNAKNDDRNFIKMCLLLVIMPIIIIFSLDYVNHYGFWYRQFVWTMLPFYAINGMIMSNILRRIFRKKYA